MSVVKYALFTALLGATLSAQAFMCSRALDSKDGYLRTPQERELGYRLYTTNELLALETNAMMGHIPDPLPEGFTLHNMVVLAERNVPSVAGHVHWRELMQDKEIELGRDVTVQEMNALIQQNPPIPSEHHSEDH